MPPHPYTFLPPSQIRYQSQPATQGFTIKQIEKTVAVEILKTNFAVRRDGGTVHITLPELGTILEYKLSQGQNRPTLMALISKNSESQVHDVSQRAFALPTLSEGGWEAIEASMKILCELRGVGPATASLILSLLYSPEAIPFFSDEATADLLNQGSIKGIKYTMKTYKELYFALRSLAEKINANKADDGEQSIGVGELERLIWHSFRRRKLAPDVPVEEGQSAGKRRRDASGEGNAAKKKKKSE